jgi:hypothetical protein
LAAWFTYQDILDRDLWDHLEEQRLQEGDLEEPWLIIRGIWREGLVATSRYVYVVRALPWASEEVRTDRHPLAALTDARAHWGPLWARLVLRFSPEGKESLWCAPAHRDKLRLTARMLARRARDEGHRQETPIPPSTPKIPRPNAQAQQEPRPTGPSRALEDLRALWELAAAGALSPEEYQAKKAEILRRL